MYVTLALYYLNNNIYLNLVFPINVKRDFLRNIIEIRYNVIEKITR